jgi:ankyrin repeat protein
MANISELCATIDTSLFHKAKTFAENKDFSILKDPQISEKVDSYGRTILHYLSVFGVLEVLDHPDVDKIKDISGRTPLHWLAERGFLTKELLIKKYTWFSTKKTKITTEVIDELLNTPFSIRFIKED